MQVIKKMIIVFIAVILGLFMLAFVVGFIQGMMGYEPEASEPTPTVQRDDKEARAPKESDKLGATAESAFMEGCMTESSRSDCQCMYDYLDDSLTNERFMEVMRQAANDNFTSESIDAIYACY